jgi:hypothetical protein
MSLADHVTTFGQSLLGRYGERVHKVAIDAGFTCPNRDGSRGRGGCTFCNNRSFSPNGRQPASVAEQIAAGRAVLRRRTGARLYLAYFQAYTNTYGAPEALDRLYRSALAEPDVVGLSVGTRPDCVDDQTLDLLAGYRQQGYEVWVELGLQSARDETLRRVNRGHGYAEYATAVPRIRARGLALCTHLIVGLPGESPGESLRTLDRVLALGVDGLKVHPLHVVRGTRLAAEWRRGEYRPLEMEEYVEATCDLVEATPPSVVFHRLTGTAAPGVLLAPAWCGGKWRVLNAIETELARRRGEGGAARSRTGARVAGSPGARPMARCA